MTGISTITQTAMSFIVSTLLPEVENSPLLQCCVLPLSLAVARPRRPPQLVQGRRCYPQAQEKIHFRLYCKRFQSRWRLTPVRKGLESPV